MIAAAPRRPAFTLVEVLVATTIMLITLTGAVSVFTFAVGVQSEGMVRNQLARDAQLVVDMLGRDLSSAGVGVPRGFRADPADFTGGTRESHQLRPLFRRFKPDHLAFVGDLPNPNADLNGIVQISHIKDDDHRTFVTSELASCVPPASSPGIYVCDTATASPLGPFPAADACREGQGGARTCPWGMNKWQMRGGSPVRLVYGGIDGSWFEREWDMTQFATSEPPYFGMHIRHSGPNGNTYDSSGAHALPQTSFFGSRGGGFIAQIDRVFWSLENPGAPGTACSATTAPFCVLRRRQCWGGIDDPAAATFPSVGDGAFRASNTPTNCTPPFDGTDWEIVATGVRALNLEAFDAAGVALTGAWTPPTAARVASVEFELVLEGLVKGNGRTLTQRMRQRVHIKNRGGIDGGIIANGGCNDLLDRPGCLGDN